MAKKLSKRAKKISDKEKGIIKDEKTLSKIAKIRKQNPKETYGRSDKAVLADYSISAKTKGVKVIKDKKTGRKKKVYIDPSKSDMGKRI